MIQDAQINSVGVHETAMAILVGLVRNHFGKRGRGRPRQNTEVSRIKNGLREMVRASGAHINSDHELAILSQMLNRSLFEEV